MRPLAARDLLRIWEQGEEQHPVDRALTILAAACPEQTWDELAALSIGQRDALLLALRELTFGPRLGGLATCLQCHGQLEFAVDVPDILQANPGGRVDPELSFTLRGSEIRFRLPNSLDLAAVARSDSVDAARRLLVRRCVLQAWNGETAVAADDLSDELITALAAEMVRRDPLSEVQLDLHCPECDQRWRTILDIVTFLWAEISAQAQRCLHEVHALAQAYGWRETDILAMSARRRQHYLEMAA